MEKAQKERNQALLQSWNRSLQKAQAKVDTCRAALKAAKAKIKETEDGQYVSRTGNPDDVRNWERARSEYGSAQQKRDKIKGRKPVFDHVEGAAQGQSRLT